uniref:Uncharacterized protein n=1 Tax=Aegilops tauschii subsp. strangulata TaxID=200361 RepID=A0A453FWV3_AEGTS
GPSITPPDRVQNQEQKRGLPYRHHYRVFRIWSRHTWIIRMAAVTRIQVPRCSRIQGQYRLHTVQKIATFLGLRSSAFIK